MDNNEELLKYIKENYPSWMNYSDTLGERPVDGLLREVWRQKEFSHQRNFQKELQQKQYNQNMGVAPEYTMDREVERHTPSSPLFNVPQGKIM